MRICRHQDFPDRATRHRDMPGTPEAQNRTHQFLAKATAFLFTARDLKQTLFDWKSDVHGSLLRVLFAISGVPSPLRPVKVKKGHFLVVFGFLSNKKFVNKSFYCDL